MKWPPGTLIVCIDDNWTDPNDEGDAPPPSLWVPKVGDYCTVRQDTVVYRSVPIPVVMIMESDPCWAYKRDHFRLAEADHCEKRALKRPLSA